MKTILKGKLTGLGIIGVLASEVFEVLPQIGTAWTTNAGNEVGVIGLVAAAATVWGWVRRFTASYKAA